MSYKTNDKNIIVGAASFYVAADTATYPSVATGSSTATSANDTFASASGWRAVGFTDGGVQVSYEPTFGDVTVDQLLDSARVFKSGMKVTVNTTFSEATLENLVVVWGQTDASRLAPATLEDDETLTIEAGSLGEAPHERQLAFIGPGPVRSSGNTRLNTERLYHVGRAIQTQTSAHDLKRDAATTLPVSFRVLPVSSDATELANTGLTAGSYGKVVDRVYNGN